MSDPTNILSRNDREGQRLEAEPSSAATIQAEEQRASEFVTHGDPTLTRNNTDPVAQRAGVQWVRPADVAARAGGIVMDRGMELNTRLRDAVFDGVSAGRSQLQDALARRQTQLDPDDNPTRAQARVLGRAGVSR